MKGLACGKAIRERNLAVGVTSSNLPFYGTRYAFVYSRQQALQSSLPRSYIDHNGPLNTSTTAFIYFTLLSWRETAGLNTNGFRRATAWDHTNTPSWSYGTISNGDVIGPWLFDDMQQGASALKWSFRTRGAPQTSTTGLRRWEWARIPVQKYLVHLRQHGRPRHGAPMRGHGGYMSLTPPREHQSVTVASRRIAGKASRR